MALHTSQQIDKFYQKFKETEVSFTKQIISATGLKTDEVFLKCLGEQWRCIIYSTSFVSAKIILSLTKESLEKIRKANNLVSLRFSFMLPDRTEPVTFFVSAKVSGYTPYKKDENELMFLTLSYTQRPPEDLIEILGTLLDAALNSQKRAEDRIPITPESLSKLGIFGKETVLYIENIPRKGILRDLSFSGAKIIVLGVAKFLQNKQVCLQLTMDEKLIKLKGMILRVDSVEGRKDLTALGIQYDSNKIPIEYKVKINDYLNILKGNK